MIDPGKVIRECRGSLNWPRAKLSDIADVQVNVIRRIELEGVDCRISTFEKILKAMGYEIVIQKKKLI
jgi:predicted transcriptional regulator